MPRLRIVGLSILIAINIFGLSLYAQNALFEEEARHRRHFHNPNRWHNQFRPHFLPEHGANHPRPKYFRHHDDEEVIDFPRRPSRPKDGPPHHSPPLPPQRPLENAKKPDKKQPANAVSTTAPKRMMVTAALNVRAKADLVTKQVSKDQSDFSQRKKDDADQRKDLKEKKPEKQDKTLPEAIHKHDGPHHRDQGVHAHPPLVNQGNPGRPPRQHPCGPEGDSRHGSDHRHAEPCVLVVGAKHSPKSHPPPPRPRPPRRHPRNGGNSKKHVSHHRIESEGKRNDKDARGSQKFMKELDYIKEHVMRMNDERREQEKRMNAERREQEKRMNAERREQEKMMNAERREQKQRKNAERREREKKTQKLKNEKSSATETRSKSAPSKKKSESSTHDLLIKMLKDPKVIAKLQQILKSSSRENAKPSKETNKQGYEASSGNHNEKGSKNTAYTGTCSAAPKCKETCEFFPKLDSKGCETCECCSVEKFAACHLDCRHGFKADRFGCPICSCV